MKQVITKHFPFGSFKALALWPWAFLKGRFTERDVRHEAIHGEQQKETLLVGFFIIYAVAWVVEALRCWADKGRGQIADPRYLPRNYWHRVAHSVIFEREAYAHDMDEYYLDRRRRFAWLKD